MKNLKLFISILSFFTFYQCEVSMYRASKEEKVEEKLENEIECDTIDSFESIVVDSKFLKKVDASFLECLIEFRNNDFFNEIYEGLSEERKENILNNRLLVIKSIYSGNVNSFKKLLPYNLSMITSAPFNSYLIDDIVRFCGQVDELHENKESSIFNLDSLSGVKMLEVYFLYDSINSVTITEKLRIPLQIMALHSPSASKYLIEKGMDVNYKVAISRQQKLSYLQIYVEQIIQPSFMVSFEGEEYSYYTKQDYLKRLNVFDRIVDEGGIVEGNQYSPHLYLFKEVLKSNNLSLMKLIVSRYKTIFEMNDNELLLKDLELSSNDQLVEYLTVEFMK